MSGGGSSPAGATGGSPALSARGALGLLDAGFALYVADPFDPERNPQGILNLGTSEKRLCFDLLEERLTRPDMNYLEPGLFQYSDAQGTGREEIAKFLTDYARAAKALNPEHVTVMNGCCAGFVFCQLYCVTLVGINPHQPPQPVRGCLPRTATERMPRVWAQQPFLSSAFSFSVPDPERTIFMWGFSKDFGMSGVRVGVLYTRNREIQKAVNQLAVFHSRPGPVQHILSQFLRDRDWLDNVIFPTNKKRLKDTQNILVGGLADVGIPALKSSGGLYVWADFRKICFQRLEQTLRIYAAGPATDYISYSVKSSTADALCNPGKDSSGKPSNTPGEDVSQLENILVY